MSAIAIVGMGCRFAKAPDLHSYWDMIVEGRNGFGPVPEDRWPVEAIFSTNRRATDKSYAPAGAFIEDIQSFPALTFGLPPRRVEVMDPQQRLALETAVQAIEDAGYKPDQLPYRTGVFLGITAHEYRVLNAFRLGATLMASGFLGEGPVDPTTIVEAVQNIVPTRPYTAPGTLGNMSAAIIAQELDLHGPAYTTDAACASAHMAIFDAINQLRTGAIDAALAGGVYICVTPEHHIVFSRIGAMSAQGECLPFDSRADGFVQGDGGGLVLLKRLEDAERDGDRIYAVIRGAAINNDGRGDGPMAPDEEGQREVIEAAWKDAQLDRGLLGYMEAHGTGTEVGDLAEFCGLKKAFPTLQSKAVIGSSKANVGHTMSAAGLAGIIRASLAIYHKTLPPMAGFKTPKEALALEESAFTIPTQPSAWESNRRYAGISSFGFGGTNGHLVLTEYARSNQVTEQPELVLLSAGSEEDLFRTAKKTAQALRRDETITVAGLSRAWGARRRQAVRVGFVATTREEAIQSLDAIANGERPTGSRMGTSDEAPKIAMMFPGQGAQRIGMLRDIQARFPVVADTLDVLETALRDDLPIPLTHLLYPERRAEYVDDAKAELQLTDTASCQPAMLACGVALHALLKQIGITPEVVIGHSLGEFTAAAAGGVFDASDAARFVARRGRAMAALPGDHGAMAAVMADRATATGLLVEGAVLANFNHPRQLVVSGTTAAVKQVVQNAANADIKAVQLSVSHGFHSPALAGLESGSLLDGITLSDPTTTVASGISEKPYIDANDARDVFMRHAVSPVDFERGLLQCQESGANLYLQVGAGGPLTAFARGSLPRDHHGVYALAGKRDDDGGRSLLEALAQLWVLGVDMDISSITGNAHLASVPPTLLPRERYWAIKNEPQLPVELAGVKPRTRQPVIQKQEPSAPELVQNQADIDIVKETVLGIVGKVSAYPRDALKPSMGLVDDLGFDSLMVGDLAAGLGEAFPNIDGIPQELLINRPSVQDIIEFARDSSTASSKAVYNDNAPLDFHQVDWKPRALPSLPDQGDIQGKRVHFLDALGTFTSQAFSTLSKAGAHLTMGSTLPQHPIDLLIYGAFNNQPIHLNAAALEQQQWPDLATDFIGCLGQLAKQTSPPDVVALTNEQDPWAAAIHGVVRSLPREWPGVQACTIHLHPECVSDVGEKVYEQWKSADRSPDILFNNNGRHIPFFSKAEQSIRWTPSSSETVLITGGTRGIGTQVALHLVELGCNAILVGRSDPSPEAQTLLETHPERVFIARADVTHREALAKALSSLPSPTAFLHCAGVLADGPLDVIDPELGRLARQVKVDGWLNVLGLCSSSLEVAVGVSSWSGRFGNRHQAHYASANALLSSMAGLSGLRTVAAEFGPWSESDMVKTIPAPIQSTMRAEGVDFVTNEAGVNSLVQALQGGVGPLILGRRIPASSEVTQWSTLLDTHTHAYLLDHAIEGTPVLPLASATDLLAATARPTCPFQLDDIKLFQGIAVTEPVTISLSSRGGKSEIRVGEKGTLAYRANVISLGEAPSEIDVLVGGSAPKTNLVSFYNGITFHGPLLQGITQIDGMTESHISGVVKTSTPTEWMPDTGRTTWAVDPLSLDSAMQLSGLVAWDLYGRAGTPVGIGRYVQYLPWPEGPLKAQVLFGAQDGDKFSGTIAIFDRHGKTVALAEDVMAELRGTDSEVEADTEAFTINPEWIDPTQWKEVVEMEQRLQMAEMAGIKNPYFRVHQGTARNTTEVDGRELVNYSSYNYLGLSGDPRVLEDVRNAVDRYGTSVSASRVASGERPFHVELEAELAAAQGAEDAIVFTAGHATNVTTIGHLFGPDDLIMHDEYIHDSALQGIKLSGAARRSFRHEDTEHLNEQLQGLRRHYKRVLIIVEGVYSMDGDICSLPQFIEIKKAHGCLLMVDEAHSFGVIGKTGCGVGEHFGIDGREVDLWMGTLSKSLASCGGWICSSKKLVNYLRYTAPGFVYSAGLTAANGIAALSSLRLMLEEKWRVDALQDNAMYFHGQLIRRKVNTGPAKGGSAVIPAITGNSMHALMLSQRMVEAGINVQPIVYPAVPDNAARLRFFLSSTHTKEQLEWTAEHCANILQQVRSEFKL